ncbi:hypothetical protein UlMin_023434 [Ulmus minor]
MYEIHVQLNSFFFSRIGQHGFVVAITSIENIGEGLIRDGTSFVTFPVKYQCVLIPDDTEFQYGDMPNYTTSYGLVKIQKDSEVRLKIIGTRVRCSFLQLFDPAINV